MQEWSGGLGAREVGPAQGGWGERALFALVVLAQLVPVWLVGTFVTQDGPAHVASAAVLRELLDGGGGGAGRYFELAPGVVPNWAGHAILVGLSYVVTPLLGEKILVSVCVLLLPIAARYALTGVRPGAGWVAWLVLPLVHARPMQMGFYSFSIGLGLLLVLVGSWLRHRERPTWGSALALGVLAVATFVSHLFCAAVGLGFIVVMSIALGMGRGAWKAWLALAPAAALTVAAAVGQAGQGGPATVTLARALRDLVALDVLVSHGPAEAYWAAGVAVLLAIAAVVACRGRGGVERSDGWAAIAVGLAIACVLARDERAMLLYVPDRLAIALVLCLALWLSAQRYRPAAQRGLIAAAALLALVGTALQVRPRLELDGQAGRILALAHHVPRSATLVAVVYAPQGVGHGPASLHTAPLMHIGGYVAAVRGAVDLSNYEGWTGHFPLRFREGVNPRGAGRTCFVEPTPDRPPLAALGRYQRETAVRVDYVLVVGAMESKPPHPFTRELAGDLAADYEHVDGNAAATLYRARTRE